MKRFLTFSEIPFLSAYLLLPLLLLILVVKANADWSDDYIDGLSQQVETFEVESPDLSLSPNKLLPLDTKNRWYYSFTNSFPPFDNEQNVEVKLGNLEALGDICIRPMIFDDGRMELLLANHNDRIVLYGFRGSFSDRQVEFLFQDGNTASVYSGILLASRSIHQVEQSQSGHFPAVVNGELIQIEWFAINKQSYSTSFNGANLQGTVAGEPSVVDEGKKVVTSFRLNIGPCELENGCFAADFYFEFIPGLGLSRFQIRGDHPEIGGQVDYLYQFQEVPGTSYFLEADSNQKGYFSCATTDMDNIDAAKGNLSIWFNIFLVFVVVLKPMSSRSRLLFGEQHI